MLISTHKLCWLMLACFCLGSIPSHSQEKEINRVLAKVDKEAITWVDLYSRGGTLDELINRKLILKAFSALNLTIGDEILDEALENFVQQRYKGDREKFLDGLKTQGISLERFRETLEESMALKALEKSYFPRDAKITAAEREATYNLIVKEYAAKETVALQIIELAKTSEGDPQAKIVKIHRELVQLSGEALEQRFTDIAKAETNKTGNVEGPDGAMIGPSILSNKVRQVISKLQPGRLSPVFDDGLMWKIVLLKKRTIPQPPEMSAIQKQVDSRAMSIKRKKYKDVFLRKIKNNSEITIYEAETNR